eukprot:c21546_g1_i1 orf=160-2502(-)
MQVASARSDASLMAIAQQLLQQHQQKQLQHQYVTSTDLHSPGGVVNPWMVSTTPPWQNRLTESGSGFYYEDSGDPRSTIGTYYVEPNNPVLDLSRPGLFLPPTESHVQNSEFLCREPHLGFMGIPKMIDCEFRETRCYDGIEKHRPVAENAAEHWYRLTDGQTSQVVSRAEEISELVGSGFFPTTPSLRLPNLQSIGFESSDITGRTDLCMGNSTSEWVDSLMGELQSDVLGEAAVAPCFESNPCESTESSELPVASATAGCYPCTSEDAWAEGFTALEEAFYMRTSSPNDVSPTSWTQDTSNEVLSSSPSRDLLSASSTELILTSSVASTLQGVQTFQSMFSVPICSDAALATERAWNYRKEEASARYTAATGGEDNAPRVKLAAEIERVGFHVSPYGLDLLHLLLECAKVVEVDTEHENAKKFIAQLRDLSSTKGDPIQRLSAYATDSLVKRMARRQGIFSSPVQEWQDSRSEELTIAYKAVNDACPHFKFAQLTANQAILDAMEMADKVHIIDFGISQGVQWAALLQAFASRPADRVRPRIRLTGVASLSLGKDPRNGLLATGRRLTEFAELLDLQFEFLPITSKFEELELSMFRIEDGETIAVNFMLQLHHLLAEVHASSETLTKTLRLAYFLSPKVVTLAEFDTSLNGGSFQQRFMNALQFFSAIFSSVDSAMPRDSAFREKMERFYFAEKMGSILGVVEKKERLAGKEEWEAIMGKAGFRCVPLGNFAVSQARLLLLLYHSESFSVVEGQGQASLSLAWRHCSLLTVSAWSLLK